MDYDTFTQQGPSFMIPRIDGFKVQKVFCLIRGCDVNVTFQSVYIKGGDW